MAAVGRHGKMHGRRGIRVADASIMPGCIRADTNGTTIMLSEKVVDYVIRGGRSNCPHPARIGKRGRPRGLRWEASPYQLRKQITKRNSS